MKNLDAMPPNPPNGLVLMASFLWQSLVRCGEGARGCELGSLKTKPAKKERAHSRYPKVVLKGSCARKSKDQDFVGKDGSVEGAPSCRAPGHDLGLTQRLM